MTHTSSLPVELWQMIYIDRHSFHPMWTEVLCDFLLKPILTVCVFKILWHKFKTSSKGNAPDFRAEVRCKHPLCHSITVLIPKLPAVGKAADFTIIVKGSFHHVPGQNFRRNVCWYKRHAIMEKLKSGKPNQVRLRQLYAADSELLKQGNFDQAYSLTTIQKISSQILTQKRYDPDPWKDLQESMRLDNENLGIDILTKKPFVVYIGAQRTICTSYAK